MISTKRKTMIIHDYDYDNNKPVSKGRTNKKAYQTLKTLKNQLNEKQLLYKNMIMIITNQYQKMQNC